ncbi:phage major capsid protein [Hansschlegelia sp.]|uniref:phage major capsid protein n=1 Tax=Hansschlegelia sp. TaxID=2041892 RepID=UPI002C5519E7|nr:phage major capsid protein [Hansschlegelia sp.]HVI28112.1 phage major capsid protein [Hansschlegelia sp.]
MSYHYPPHDFVLKDAGDADVSADVTKALETLQGDVLARIEAAEKKAADRLEALEKKAARPAPANGASDGETVEKALTSYIRSGDDTELKALSITGAGATGGVLAPPQFGTSILEKVREVSPIRALAPAITISSNVIKLPRLVNKVAPANVTETGTRATAEPSFEQIEISVFEDAVDVPVTKWQLEDSNLNLAAWLQGHIIAGFAEKEGRDFVVGDGVTQAEGVMTSTEVQTLTTAETTLKVDDFIDAFYGLKTAHARKAVWLMARPTMAIVRKLRDGEGNLIWQDGNLAGGQPSTILGAPVYEAVDMPSAASGATPVLFGDFAAGYQIVDHVSLELEQDRLTEWKKGLVHQLARRRFGGRVVNGEAFVKLKLKAS